MSRDLKELEGLIDYEFHNKELLQTAMTHSSFANELKINKRECNERLEFLGDAVLELVSSDMIFGQFPDMPEGKMSKLRASLVCEPALYESAGDISLGEFVCLGKGEEAGGGRSKPSVVSDAFEALIGAVYLDGGIEPAKRIIMKHILSEARIEGAKINDSKSLLQEIIQAKDKHGDIVYEVVEENGPEHAKEFVVRVLVGGEELGRGSGKNKKAAEKAAAYKAVINLE